MQKLLLVQNPESYIIHNTGSKSAVIVMEKATLSWTKPLQTPDTEDRDDLVSEPGPSDVLPTLRNISFTLNKVNMVFT